MPNHEVLRVGLLGAGYIAEFHAKALKSISSIQLTAICDQNFSKAKKMAKYFGIPRTYASLDEMLAKEKLDVIHLLLPAPGHFQAAKQILKKKIHLFLEKPICLLAKEAEELIQLARINNRLLGVNHNFLFYPIYEKMKNHLQNKDIGPIQNICINWQLEFEPAGTYLPSPWLYENPLQIFLETGIHPLAMLSDLVGLPENYTLEADAPVILPNQKTVFRHWRLNGSFRNTAVSLLFSFLPGETNRSITLLGKIGHSKIDFEENTVITKLHTKYRTDLDRFWISLRSSQQLKQQAFNTLRKVIFSKLHLFGALDPYAESLQKSIQTFYHNFPNKLDPRHDPVFGKNLIAFCNDAIARLPTPPPSVEKKLPAPSSLKPSILVLGAGGFIGQALVHQLLREGLTVRILVRSIVKLPFASGTAHLEIIEGDIFTEETLNKAMQGIQTVFHLARGSGTSWEEYQATEVEMARLVAKACLKENIRRLIYTSTIDVYYAGNRNDIITEQTPLDPAISTRNFYARAKAESEYLLMSLFRLENLPVVIFRPGIVIGPGGPPFHLGIAQWQHHGAVCQYYGKGKRPLPLVLIEDTIAALIKGMNHPGIDGESFNLIGPPLISAREYTNELSRVLQMHIQEFGTPIWRYYATDIGKWVLKTLIRSPQRKFPSYRDWKTRTQQAFYDCSKARSVLQWQPEEDFCLLVEKGIKEPALQANF